MRVALCTDLDYRNGESERLISTNLFLEQVRVNIKEKGACFHEASSFFCVWLVYWLTVQIAWLIDVVQPFTERTFA